MSHLILYTTAGCHLCEIAKEMLWPLLTSYQLYLQEIDIAESDDLIAAYGVRIPVLASKVADKELGWPFDESQVRSFIESIKH